MGRAFSVIAEATVVTAALVVAYELGRERGAKEMFFKWTEAYLEIKAKEKREQVNESNN